MSSDTQATTLPTLTGACAFEILQRVLQGEAVEPGTLPEPAFDRLLSALMDKHARPSPLDLAVLIRHALRYHALQQESGESVRTIVRSGEGWPTAEQWVYVGVNALPTTGGFWVSAQPWRPPWMPHVGKRGVDAAAAQAIERRMLQATPGDPFLAGLRREDYHSAGQRAAMRAALTTPPGATLLVCLPTGEGKSLIFQAIAEYGFGDGESGIGVTLVITPTVALALDHERAAVELGLPDQPRAYIGGQDHALTNQLIFERIADGIQGLCFASPEAVCGPLRSALARAARAGRLRALVVDEAHLVDAWGGNFRSEFQILSGIRHDLLREQGAAPTFRTILLSATITPQAESTLKVLFGAEVDGKPGQYAVSAAVKLRPEIEYWVAPLCEEEERRARVLEAICRLPRPAILYTTRVKAADRWYTVLHEMGFRRIACVTGETDSFKRQSVIEGWRNGSIDLVVGTSAFGLGIDNPHVRTVIHACIPETLDRFYQEVGRGGRDGHTSISLLIPTEYDRKTAYGLNKRRTITVERGFQRWQAMFSHRDSRRLGDNTFTLRLDVPPGFNERDIDMLSGRNTDWNTRTLTLMATSGLITLQGAGVQNAPTSDTGSSASVGSMEESVNDSDPLPVAPGIYQTVRIHEPRHLDRDTWEQVVDPQRVALAEANQQSLQRMLDFLRQRQCVADTLAPQYELRPVQVIQDDSALVQAPASDIHVARACGGCGYCRASEHKPYSEAATATRYPWFPPPAPRNLVDETNRLVIYYPPATHPVAHVSTAPRAKRRRDQEMLANLLLNNRIRNMIILPGSGLNLVSVQSGLPHWPLFRSDHLVSPHLPPGATLVVVAPGVRLTALQLAPQAWDHARIYLLPEGFEDPTRPGILLRESYDGREVEWDNLSRELHL